MAIAAAPTMPVCVSAGSVVAVRTGAAVTRLRAAARRVIATHVVPGIAIDHCSALGQGTIGVRAALLCVRPTGDLTDTTLADAAGAIPVVAAAASCCVGIAKSVIAVARGALGVCAAVLADRNPARAVALACGYLIIVIAAVAVVVARRSFVLAAEVTRRVAAAHAALRCASARRALDQRATPCYATERA